METLLFGMIMLAFGWLVLWVCIDRSEPSRTWWPFDYRDRGEPRRAEIQPNDRRPWDRRTPKQPWKRSGF